MNLVRYMNIKKLIRKIPILIFLIRKIIKILDRISYLFIKERSLQTLYFGRIFRYPARSEIGKLIKKGYLWDAGIIRYYAKILPKDSFVIEVGSNIGASTIVISEFLPNSKFILVEASERYFQYCKSNTSHLKKEKRIIDIIQKIISNNTNKLVRLQTNHTTGTVLDIKKSYGYATTSSSEYQTETLDNITEKYDLRKVDLLKIDTDGFEVEVFQGAKQLINKYKPIIHTEFSPNSLERNNINGKLILISFLQEIGINVFYIHQLDTGKYLGKATNINEILEIKGKDYYVDIICTPNDSNYYLELEKNYKVLEN